MKLVINSKSNDVRSFVKKEVEERFKKLDKYFTDEATANVMFSEEGSNKKVEITFRIKNNVLHSEVSDMDFRTAADRAIDRIEKQLVKYKDKLKKRNTESIRYENIKSTEEAPVHYIVKHKKFALEPISTAEACFQLELLDHQFYMFLNQDTDNINVVYRRDDGDYGLIEPEN
jgi:putative sigma-54 modulation protein